MAALGINLPGLIAQIINFSLLIVVLYFVLYKPVLKMLDQRATRIKESLAQADRVRQESAQAEEQVKAQIEAARVEGRTIVGQATQVADRLKEEARGQAKQEADAIVARARTEIEREREEAMEALRRDFADLTMRAAGRVINASLDARQHQRLIEEVLREGVALRKN